MWFGDPLCVQGLVTLTTRCFRQFSFRRPGLQKGLHAALALDLTGLEILKLRNRQSSHVASEMEISSVGSLVLDFLFTHVAFKLRAGSLNSKP